MLEIGRPIEWLPSNLNEDRVRGFRRECSLKWKKNTEKSQGKLLFKREDQCLSNLTVARLLIAEESKRMNKAEKKIA